MAHHPSDLPGKSRAAEAHITRLIAESREARERARRLREPPPDEARAGAEGEPPGPEQPGNG